MNFLTDIFKGIVIGAGAILPGISSGVLCVIFGIYEKLLDSILNFFKDVKTNFKFLFPLVLGGVIGIVLFSNILKYILYSYPIQTKSIFIGLILGTIPILLKGVNQKEKFKKSQLLFLLIALVIGVAIVKLENMIPIFDANNHDFMYFILVGCLMSIGVIVPGVSSTIILMLLGVYSTYLQSVSMLYFPVLIPIGIGLVLGSIFCMKITKKLLDAYYAQTFYTIIGFTLGSVFVLIPDISNLLEIVISLLCIMIGWNVSKCFK